MKDKKLVYRIEPNPVGEGFCLLDPSQTAREISTSSRFLADLAFDTLGADEVVFDGHVLLAEQSP